MPLTDHIPPVYRGKDVLADPSKWNKVSSYVSHADWQLINSVVAQSGAISYIIDHAIHTTAEAIRANGINPITDTPRFLDWLRQRTFSELTPSPQGTTSDDAGRTPSPRGDAPRPTDVGSSTGPDVKTRSGYRGRKARAGEA